MAHPVPPEAPPLGGAPEVPAAPGLPAPRGLPRNYRELLSDEANAHPRDRLANYLNGYRFEGGGLAAPTTLREQTVVLSDRQPITFLCLTVGAHGIPEVSILHRLMRYMDMPGEDDSGFHDRHLGLLGDIRPHQYPTVEVPSTVFHLKKARRYEYLPSGPWEHTLPHGRMQLCHWVPSMRTPPKLR